ncbi:hypothetical protein HUJ04_013378 [Dendroctonus ponderosae]
MKCHYEVLQLSQDADDSEIKTAYRRLALKLHPDKNLDNPELAKEQFQTVQQAYEVLSDRQERAWYDAHRDQILRGTDSEFQDQSLDVFPYFTSSCFKGFGDDAQGFYTIYRTVFEAIAKEDLEFMDDKEEFSEIPGFGCADSDYEAVKLFYDYWMSYSTKKSYTWLDPYDVRDVKGNRKVEKIADKENKKVRTKARKERNEEVRKLAAFVRKRDKRVLAYKDQMESKVLENRKKHQELGNRKKLERAEMHANEKQAEWLKFDNVQDELEEIEAQLAEQFGESLLLEGSEEDDDEYNSLFCRVCMKQLKNPTAFQNHEMSKKHRETNRRLQEILLEEQRERQQHAFGLPKPELNCSDSDGEQPPTEAEPDENPVSDPDEQQSFNSNSKKSNKPPVEEREEIPKQKKSTKKRKKKDKADEPSGDHNDIDLAHCCATCKCSFSSKNKLFDHLKATNHGVYLPAKDKRTRGKN